MDETHDQSEEAALTLMDNHTPEDSNARGIIKELGDLPAGAIVNEEALARIFRRHQVSIKRAVQRGELPPPIRLLGAPVWTVGVILQHLKERLDTAKKEADDTARRFHDLRP